MGLLAEAAPQLTVLNMIQRQNSIGLMQMKASARIVFDLLWHSKSKTPQEICDMLGADAVKAFDAHAKLQELIYFIDNTWIPLVPPKEYTKNQDGTVVIHA